MNNQQLSNSYDVFESTYGRSGSLFIIIALFILLLSITRGLIVISMGGLVEASSIYNLVFLILLIFTVYCFFDQQRMRYPSTLRLFLYLNLLFYISWFLPELLATRDLKFFLICSVIPFVMFGFMKIPSIYLRRVFFFILFLVAVTTMIDFIMSNIPRFELRDYREQLRLMINPDQQAPTRVGYLLRSVGISGSEHETSCLLAMLIAYVLALRERYISRTMRVILVYLGLLAILFTLSTSNTIVAAAAIVLIVFYYFRRKKYFNTILVSLPFIVFFFYLNLTPDNLTKASDINVVDAVYMKIDPRTADWTALLTLRTDDNRLTQDGTLVCYYWQDGCSYIFNEFGGLIIGHEGATQMGEYGRITEIGLLRMMWETGFTSFLCFLLVIFFPALLYFTSDKFTRRAMFPYFCAVATGLATLIHYGALFRTTNIFIFYAFYGACIRQYLISKAFKRKFTDQLI
jgi:hypothetical protein